MEHYLFFILVSIPLTALFLYDRKNVKKYLVLGVLAILLDLLWDPFWINMGLWSYSSQPQVLGASVYMLLLYVHYMSFCYFMGNKIAAHVRRKR